MVQIYAQNAPKYYYAPVRAGAGYYYTPVLGGGGYYYTPV